MDPISNFLTVRDAISKAKNLGTKIGYDFSYENAEMDGCEIFPKEKPDCICLLKKNAKVIEVTCVKYKEDENGEEIEYFEKVKVLDVKDIYIEDAIYYEEDIQDLFEDVDKVDKVDVEEKGDTCPCGNSYSFLILDKLERLINKIEDVSAYCIGNRKSMYWEKNFMVTTGSQKEVYFFDLDVATLEKEGTPAPFGDLTTMETVIDPTVRTALELEFSVDLIGHLKKMVSNDIKSKLNNNNEIDLVPHKINVYHKGSFFKPHVDTPIADNMIGTLVLTFPTRYEGGDLIIKQKNSSRVFNYNDLDRTDLGWVAFYGDCVHEVTPVTSGVRVTFTFYIMNKKDEKVREYDTTQIDGHMEKIISYLKQYKDQGNEYLGLFTQQRYTMNGTNKLKGIDEDVYRYLQNADASNILKKHMIPEVANIIRGYNLSIDIQVMPVLVYYNRSSDYDDYNEKDSKIIACTEKDFNYVQGMIKEKPDHGLPSNIQFIGKMFSGKKIKSAEEPYIEHTGNQSQPYSYNGIYLSAVMILKF